MHPELNYYLGINGQPVSRPQEKLLILLAWEAGELSEGQASRALGLDRVSARHFRQIAIAAGRELGDARADKGPGYLESIEGYRG